MVNNVTGNNGAGANFAPITPEAIATQKKEGPDETGGASGSNVTEATTKAALGRISEEVTDQAPHPSSLAGKKITPLTSPLTSPFPLLVLKLMLLNGTISLTDTVSLVFLIEPDQLLGTLQSLSSQRRQELYNAILKLEKEGTIGEECQAPLKLLLLDDKIKPLDAFDDAADFITSSKSLSEGILNLILNKLTDEKRIELARLVAQDVSSSGLLKLLINHTDAISPVQIFDDLNKFIDYVKTALKNDVIEQRDVIKQLIHHPSISAQDRAQIAHALVINVSNIKKEDGNSSNIQVKNTLVFLRNCMEKEIDIEAKFNDKNLLEVANTFSYIDDDREVDDDMLRASYVRNNQALVLTQLLYGSSFMRELIGIGERDDRETAVEFIRAYVYKQMHDL